MFGKAIVAKSAIPLLHRCLDAYSLRHKAIANNIANVEAPGYSRARVRFEDKLKKALFDSSQAMVTTNEKHIGERERHIEKVQPEVEIDTANGALNGMNNVDIDQEMANLAKNTLDYNTAATLLRHEYTRFRLSMGGGGGAR